MITFWFKRTKVLKYIVISTMFFAVRLYLSNFAL